MKYSLYFFSYLPTLFHLPSNNKSNWNDLINAMHSKKIGDNCKIQWPAAKKDHRLMELLLQRHEGLGVWAMLSKTLQILMLTTTCTVK